MNIIKFDEKFLVFGIFMVVLITVVAGFAMNFYEITGQAPINIPFKNPVIPNPIIKSPICPRTVSCSPGQIIGDINGDGKLTILDTNAELCLALGRTQLPKDLCCTDIPPNPDGKINAIDVQRVINIVNSQNPPGKCSTQQTSALGLISTISMVPPGIPAASTPIKMVAKGNYLYVVTNEGLFIYDIFNPANPVLTGYYHHGSGLNWDVDIDGNYAFLANGQDIVVVVDISDKRNPRFVSRYRSTSTVNGGGGLRFNQQRFALVADVGTGGVLVFNNNPLALQLLSFTRTPQNCNPQQLPGCRSTYSVFPYKEKALLGINDISQNQNLGGNEIQLLNIGLQPSLTNPPKLIDQFRTTGKLTDIFVKDDVAYVIEQDAQLLMFDLTDPTDPLKYLGFYNGAQFPYGERSVKVVRDQNNKLIALVANTFLNPFGGSRPVGAGRLDLVDVTDPRNPIFLKRYDVKNPLINPPSTISGAGYSPTGGSHLNYVEVRGDYAYLADLWGFVHVVKWQ